jgi:transposase-like protein
VASAALRGVPRPERRKVERPSFEALMTDIASMSFVAVARKYGVSDNAVRKWIRWYEYEREMADSRKEDELADEEPA